MLTYNVFCISGINKKIPYNFQGEDVFSNGLSFIAYIE